MLTVLGEVVLEAALVYILVDEHILIVLVTVTQQLDQMMMAHLPKIIHLWLRLIAQMKPIIQQLVVVGDFKFPAEGRIVRGY